MSHIFPRENRNPPPMAARGEGIYLYDIEGRKYLDGSSGAAVSGLGHSDEDVKQAIRDQLDRLTFAHSGFFTSDPAEKMADKLIAHAPKGLDRVYVVSGGSEAMEAAIKLARQYHLENGQPQRRHLISRKQSYHGNTLGALATGGNAWRREPFEPLLFQTHQIDPCYAYRLMREGEAPEDYGLRAAQQLEDKIEELGPENVMAFVAEPVVGATAGAVPPAPGYFQRVREICEAHGVLLILDEVMCGMGRTGSLFACEQDGISPDIMAIAKGLGAGYQPIGAMLCSQTIYDTISQNSGFFQHGHTYIGHSTACAAANAVLAKLIDGGLVEKARARGRYMIEALHSAFGQHPHIGDIRGRGLFLGLEIVEDRGEKRPFDPARKTHKAIKKTAFENGLICYPMGGTIDGRQGDHVLLAPPLIIEEPQIDELIEKLTRTFKQVLS